MIPLLSALLVAVGGFAAILAVRLRRDRRVHNLSALLDDYSGSTVSLEEDDDLRAALARTGRLAERAFAETSVLAKVRRTLARSDWTLTPGEFLATSAGLALGGVLIGLLSSAIPLAVLLGLAGIALPYVLVTTSVSRRRRRFDDQLPDVLDLLAASLESGAGIAQALELVVAEAPEPTATEFARVLAATRLGSSLVEGLEQMAERLDSRDLVYTVQAISVQQRTGGRLAEVLQIVAEFMRGRFELKREISALTAEGRLSAYLLGGLPFAIAGLVSLLNPGYLSPLFTTGVGIAMVSVAGLLMLISFFFMSRIIKIEV